MKTEENAPAFPSMDMNQHMGIDRLELRYEGLTKREYFAAMALQGILSSREIQLAIISDRETYEGCAVEHADRLIKELNK